MNRLLQKIKSLPPKPGVYLFKNAAGGILYVGKAKNLKKRVVSYFQKRARDPKTESLVAKIADLDYVIVSSELEALMLENNLIKKYLPHYNILLRDDKNWQFIKIDYETEIPQIATVRKIQNQGGEKAGVSKYFGPFTSGLAVKNTLRLLKKIFHICGNKKIGNKPCFQYHLGRCPGVCIGKISVAAYRKKLKQVELFLKNRQAEILQKLKKQMLKAASERRFESASSFRDIISALQRIWEKQKIISPRKLSEDYLGLCRSGKTAVVKLFQIRDGKLCGQETFELKIQGGETEPEILQAFADQYYSAAQDRPKTIISRLRPPRRGKKLGLLRLAEENAKEYFEKNFQMPEQILLNLKTILNLPRLPQRIEGYDISNLQGTNPVGSMVVFENGLPKKTDYRKFKIQTKNTPDDVGMMKEMLTRRLRQNWPLPDLIIVDGGRPQLNMTKKILTAYSLQLPCIGLAKRLEEIYLPGQIKPLRLPPDHPALQLLQRVRDEAHRFAISFYRHRQLKTFLP